MPVDEIEESAVCEKARDKLSPVVEIGEPAKDAVGGEDDVEPSTEVLRQLIDVRADKARLERELGCEFTCQRDRVR